MGELLHKEGRKGGREAEGEWEIETDGSKAEGDSQCETEGERQCKTE
jgi:hypothetical protein